MERLISGWKWSVYFLDLVFIHCSRLITGLGAPALIWMKAHAQVTALRGIFFF
jgi:hypothetical protein